MYNAVPSAPLNLTAMTTNTTYIHLSWEPPATLYASQLGPYFITYRIDQTTEVVCFNICVFRCDFIKLLAKIVIIGCFPIQVSIHKKMTSQHSPCESAFRVTGGQGGRGMTRVSNRNSGKLYIKY